MNRRTFFQGSLAMAGSAALAATAFGKKKQERRRTLRMAHLTDVHVLPDRGAPEKFAKALQHVQSLKDRPDFIFNGGDCIMDALKHNKVEVAAQWKEWQAVMANELELPVYSAIGNHDVWGWANDDRKSNGEYGKRWAMDELQLKERYYVFEKGGWQFVVLDSVHKDADRERGYTAKLDEEQFEWLSETLGRLDPKKPISILSHIPIVSFCPFFDGENEKSGDWAVPGPWMHIDARRLKDLFLPHDNIKVALSGHIHLIDDVEYLNVRYLCNGAVSGGWWDGNYQEFGPVYALIDYYDDGTVERQFVNYLEA